jgi:hypothetical protein
MLKITHNAGFFSCCNIRLKSILEYFNKHKMLPNIVDSSVQFHKYRTKSGDLTFDYFENYDNIPIEIIYNNNVPIVFSDTEDQFSDYSKLNFSEVIPFIAKYFSPSTEVIRIKEVIESKYQIDIENTCVVFYRGTDKCIETTQPSYAEMIDKAKEIQKQNPNIRFLIQTDQREFLDFALKNLNNSFEINELPKLTKNITLQLNNNQEKIICSIWYFAVILIMAKCKYIVTTSGNGEMFTILYRGNTKNIYQYLNPKEYIYGVKNNSYDSNKKDFWIIHKSGLLSINS